MEPTAQLALAVTVAGVVYLAVGAACDVVRLLGRVRLPWLPSLRPVLAAVVLAGTLLRAAPAGAALPPPRERLGSVPPSRTVAAMSVTDDLPNAPRTESALVSYVVRPGDSLWAIAARTLRADGRDTDAASVDRYWRLIYEANRPLIGSDPDLIYPGQTLAIPEAA